MDLFEGGDTAGGPVTWCYDSGSESAVSFGTPVRAPYLGCGGIQAMIEVGVRINT